MKWIKDLNVRPEIVKPEEENKKRKLLYIHLGNDFLDMTPKSQATKAKINKWIYIRPKALYSKRNNQQNEKAAYRMGENICKLSIC